MGEEGCAAFLNGFLFFGMVHIRRYRPPVVSSNEFLGLVSSRMSSNNRIMVFTDNILMKFLVVRNVYSFFCMW